MTVETKPWRAEVPSTYSGSLFSPEVRVVHGDDVAAIVTCANAELDAKDARIAELERDKKLDEETILIQRESLNRNRSERDEAISRAEKAEKRADGYQRDWYEAKQQFGDAMGRGRAQIRELEARLGCLAESAVKVLASKAPTIVLERTEASELAELADRKKYDEDVRCVSGIVWRNAIECSEAIDRLRAAPYWKGGE